MPHRKVIVVYHSVGSETVPAVAGSFPVVLDRFKHQIREAARLGWRFGRLSELRRPVQSETLYITGDDGTVDWVRNVLPWCEQEGIPTHTAIITGPWGVDGSPVWPVAHRVQILLTLPHHEPPINPESMLSADQVAYIDRVYHYETDARRRYLKGACNVVLSDDEARVLLGEPCDEEVALLRKRFAAPEEYRGYRYAEFGVHTVSHRAFDGGAEGYAAYEVDACARAMQKAGLDPTMYFTLPMRPRFPATVEQLAPELRSRGYEGILDSAGKWNRESYIIPRVDAKNVEECLGCSPFAAAMEIAA